VRLGGRWTATTPGAPGNAQFIAKVDGRVEGSLGAGAAGYIAIEGFAAAQGEAEWQSAASKWVAKLVGSVGVRAYAFIYQIFSYEWTISQTEFDSAAESPTEAEAPQPPRLADRDYLQRAGHRERPPLPAADLAAPLSNAKHSQVLTVEGDVYPRSGATLSAQGTRTIAAWLADDDSRSSVNRTRVQFAESTSAAPLAFGAATPIAGDGTADFHPVALALPDRRDVVIYQNVKSVLPDTATLEQMAAGMDIAVSERNPATNAWTTTALSADTTYDGPPRIAGPGADNLIAVWPSNPANDFFGGPSKPWTFYWRARTAGGWSARQAVAAFPYGIAGYDLHYQDGRARLIVAADLDGLIGTVDDRELFAIAFDGTSWASSFTRLTNDTVGDENPVSFLDAAGEVQVAWLRSGAIRMAPLADPQLAVDVAPAADSSNAVGGTWTRSANGDAALVWVDSLNGQTDVMMVRRNSAGGDWSERIQLTEDTAVERYAAAAIRGDGQIVAIYNRLRSAPAVGTAEVVDLYALRNELVTDVALAAGSLQLRPLNPRAGEVVTGTLTVENVGGQPVSGLEVAVKVTSGSGSGEVARQSLAQLAAGASDEIEFTFTAPDGLTALAATADPDEHVADVDRANNMLTLSLGLTDLWVSDLRVSPNSDGTLGMRQHRPSSSGRAAWTGRSWGLRPFPRWQWARRVMSRPPGTAPGPRPSRSSSSPPQMRPPRSRSSTRATTASRSASGFRSPSAPSRQNSRRRSRFAARPSISAPGPVAAAPAPRRCGSASRRVAWRSRRSMPLTVRAGPRLLHSTGRSFSPPATKSPASRSRQASTTSPSARSARSAVSA
jgi:hypothetical protein